MGRALQPERREVLLEKTTDYLLRHGVAELSLRPLAAELETTPRGLLYHFGAKETLVSEALEHALGRQREMVREWIAESSPETLSEVLERVWNWCVDTETRSFLRLFFEVFGLALQYTERYPSTLVEAVGELRLLAENALIEATVPRAVAEELSTLLLASYRGLVLDFLATGDLHRVDRAHKRLVKQTAARVESLTHGEAGRTTSQARELP